MSKSSKFSWPDNVTFEPKADDDFAGLDNTQQIAVFKAIVKVAANPLPRPNGLGKPLSGKLSGYCKIKLKDYGIRIIYRLDPPDSNDLDVIIIGMRSDNEVYDSAMDRIKKC